MALVGLLLFLGRDLLLPLLVGIVLAYLLHPLVTRVVARGVRRAVAVAAVLLAIGLVVVGASILVGQRLYTEAMALASNLPTLSVRVEFAIDAGIDAAAQSYPAVHELLPAERRRAGWLERFIDERAGTISERLGNAGRLAFALLLSPLFAYFLLRDGNRVVTHLIHRLHAAHMETTVAIWCAIDRIIGRYLVRLTLESIGVGIATTAGLWAIGVPYPLLLGALTTVVNPIPYLGTLFSLAAAAVVSLAHGQGLDTLAWIVALFLIIRVLDDFVIVPVLIGRSLHLHPLVVVVSIVVGEQALGLLGMVIAVLAVSLIKETTQLLLQHRRTLSFHRLVAPRDPPPTPTYIC